jgi:hypothetical protein
MQRRKSDARRRSQPGSRSRFQEEDMADGAEVG